MFSWWPSPLERRIALRYLRGQRGTRTTSLQTLIAVGGIAAGVTALIIVLGVMNGLRNDLRDRILIASPHLHVLTFGEELRIDDWEIPLAKIRAGRGCRGRRARGGRDDACSPTAPGIPRWPRWQVSSRAPARAT